MANATTIATNLHDMPGPIVFTEIESPEKIEYRRGAVFQYLYGAHAWLYRQMIGVYGKPEATERFWWLWNEKGE